MARFWRFWTPFWVKFWWFLVNFCCFLINFWTSFWNPVFGPHFWSIFGPQFWTQFWTPFLINFWTPILIAMFEFNFGPNFGTNFWPKFWLQCLNSILDTILEPRFYKINYCDQLLKQFCMKLINERVLNWLKSVLQRSCVMKQMILLNPNSTSCCFDWASDHQLTIGLNIDHNNQYINQTRGKNSQFVKKQSIGVGTCQSQAYSRTKQVTAK